MFLKDRSPIFIQEAIENKFSPGYLLDHFKEFSLVKISGFDDLKVSYVFDAKGVHLLYSESSLYEILIRQEKMTFDEASDWFYYNIIDLSDLDGGPLFLEDLC